jgi:ribonuclease P protein subunit RPR2
MKQKRSEKPREHTEIAMQRINTLFEEAKKAFPSEPGLADRYVKLATTISTKFRVRLPQAIKKQFCHGCRSYLSPGSNCAIRLSKGSLIYHCLSCDTIQRYPLDKEHRPLVRPKDN